MNKQSITFDRDDVLGRKTFALNILKIINDYNKLNRNNHSLVISLDSAWGTGKSWFIHMWRNLIIENKTNIYNKYYTIYYNAWENDDWDNTFIPFINCIRDEYSFPETKVNVDNLIKKGNAFMKSCGISIAKDMLTRAIGNNIAEVISDALLKANEESTEKDYCAEYAEYLKQKNAFCDGIKTLVPANGKLIIFIDELDRCRPDFAIQTLEMIKHFFNIENVVFIVSVDMIQLSYSISTIYGNGMDSTGYLSRFFDLCFKMPSPNINQYVHYKFLPISNEPRYKSIMNSGFESTIEYLYTSLNLSLRDMDKITNNFISFILFYDTQLNSHEKGLEIYLYFLIMKYKYPDKYNLILNEKFVSHSEQYKHIAVLDAKFFVNGVVSELLNRIKLKGARYYEGDYIQEFNLFKDNTQSKSLGEHIEKVIEMFC